MPEIPTKGGVFLLLAHTEKVMNTIEAFSPGFLITSTGKANSKSSIKAGRDDE